MFLLASCQLLFANCCLEFHFFHQRPQQTVKPGDIARGEAEKLGSPGAVRDFHGQNATGKTHSAGTRGNFLAAHQRPCEHHGFFRRLRPQEFAHDVAQASADGFHGFSRFER